jgi:hypothetical protein
MAAMQKVTGFEKALSGINKTIQAIGAAKDLSLNDKQKNIDAIYTNSLPMIENYTKQLQQQMDRALRFKGYGQ